MAVRRVSTGKAAEKLGCSTQHVRDLIEDGKLDAYQDESDRWRITLESVERHIERCNSAASREKANSAHSAK